MATVSRRFTRYHITAFDVTISEDMTPSLVQLADFEMLTTTLSDRTARVLVRDELGSNRLPSTCVVKYEPVATEVYAMDADAFLAAATLVETSTVTDSEE